MSNFKLLSIAVVSAFLALSACDSAETIAPADTVSPEIITALEQLGFDVEDQAPIVFDEGFLVEGDIYLTEEQIRNMAPADPLRIATEEQYSTNNLVVTGGTTASRTISIYISSNGSLSSGSGGTGGSRAGQARGGKKPDGGGGGGGADFPNEYGEALDLAIDRYNSEGLELAFARATSSSDADIVISRLAKGDERRGVLGSAGFPTSSGDPYSEIKMSGVLQSSYGVGVAGIATILAHEIGHCIGFRHTDYFNRSISCGGSPYNEGDAGIGANHIPGTPTGATRAAKSWMLSCTDGGDRPFNNDDKTALDYLY